MQKQVSAYRSIVQFGGVVTLAVMFSACELKPPEKKEKAESGEEAYEYEIQDAKKIRAFRGILHEMLTVVLEMTPDQSLKEIPEYVSALNQGAAIVGLYNGMTHSSRYRRLEVQNKGSSLEAIKVFSKEMARLNLELSKPNSYSREDAMPLALPVQPGGPASPDTPKELSFSGGKEEEKVSDDKRPTLEEMTDLISKTFLGASPYTLKRVIGDLALEVVNEKSSNTTNLSEWYGAWVMEMLKYEIDFGFNLRNKKDRKFHEDWAQTATVDVLKWEVLNRLHRVLKQKSGESS